MSSNITKVSCWNNKKTDKNPTKKDKILKVEIEIEIRPFDLYIFDEKISTQARLFAKISVFCTIEMIY